MSPTAHFPRVVVAGAGTMGAQLACLLAGSGSRVTLLDVDAATAKTGLDRAAKLRPSPVYVSAHLDRIRVCGLDQLQSAVEQPDSLAEPEHIGPH